MNVVYYLATCDTCKRILKQLQLPENLIYRELKSCPISENELEKLYFITKSYEILLNKQSKLYKEYGLKDKVLTENDCKNLILEHYTFLKRPVFVIKNEIFIGNSAKTIESLEKFLNHAC